MPPPRSTRARSRPRSTRKEGASPRSSPAARAATIFRSPSSTPALQGSTTQAFVSGLYKSLLGRAADPGGFNFYVGLLQGGMSRFQVTQMILDSSEGRDTEVARWYRDDLGWTASLATLKADPGVDYWAGMLVAGQIDDQVLNTILNVSQGSTSTGFVTGLYHALLGRAPDPAGLSYFVGLYNAGMSRAP